MSLGTRWVLLAGFGGLILLLAALGLSSIVVLNKVERIDQDESRRFIAHAAVIHQFRDRLSDAFSATRNYLMDRQRSDTEARRQRVNEAWRAAEKALVNVQAAPLPGQAEPLARIAEDAAVYEGIGKQTNAWTSRELDVRGYEWLTQKLDPTRARILTALDSVVRIDEDHLRTSLVSSTQEIATLKLRLRWTIAIALLLGLGLAAFSIRQVIRLERVAAARYEALTEAYEEQGRLSQRILEVQEQERKTLARELHDEVSQSLGAMLVDLGTLQERSVHLDAAKRIGNDVLNSIRNICLLLRPSMLDDLGLVAALHWQARETLRRSGIRVNVITDEDDMELPDAHRTAVYRIVQEALQNIIRHSGAKQVQIVIRREMRRLTVVVQDDGKGFSPKVTRGLGLLGMHERAHSLDGSMNIESEPGKGTILSFQLPLELEVTA